MPRKAERLSPRDTQPASRNPSPLSNKFYSLSSLPSTLWWRSFFFVILVAQKVDKHGSEMGCPDEKFIFHLGVCPLPCQLTNSQYITDGDMSSLRYGTSQVGYICILRQIGLLAIAVSTSALAQNHTAGRCPTPWPSRHASACRSAGCRMCRRPPL